MQDDEGVEIVDAPPGPPPDDQDPGEEQEEAYLGDLYRSLNGTRLSDNFREVLDDRVNRLQQLSQQRTEDISAEDLNGIHLVAATDMFSSEAAQQEAQERRRKITRVLSALTKSGREANAVEAERHAQQSNWEKLRDSIATQIEKDLREAMDENRSATTPEAHQQSGARVTYLALGQRCFEATRYQEGFALYEDARALKTLAQYAESVAGQAAHPLPEGSFAEPDQTRDGTQRDDSDPALLQPVRDLVDKKNDLEIDVARLDALFAKVFRGDSEEKTALADSRNALQDIDLSQFDPLPDPPEQTDLDRVEAYDAELRRIETVLNGLSAVGTDAASDAIADAHEKLKALIVFADDSAARVNADVDGAGEILLRSKAKHVPQSVVRPIVARLDALMLMASQGDLSASQYEMIATLSDELERKVNYAVQHKDTYKACDRLIKEIKGKLAKDYFAFFTSAHTELTNQLERLEDPANDDAADRLLRQLRALKEQVWTDADTAKDNKTNFEELVKLRDKKRKKVLDAYKKTLKKIVKLPAVDGTDEAALKDKLKVFKKELETEGRYAARFDEIWSDVTQGDATTYDPVERELSDKTDEWLRKIERLSDSADRLRDMFKGSGSHYETLDQFLSSASEHNQDRQIIAGAVKDIADGDAEINLRKSLEEDFKSKRRALKKFIKGEADSIDKDAREAFENYLHLLGALKSRSELATNSQEWKDIVVEVDRYDRTIREFAAKHQKVDDLKTLTEKLARAAQSLVTCHDDIADFYQKTRDLATRITTNGKQDALAAAQAQNIAAEHVHTLLEHRGGKLVDFLDIIGRTASGDQLDAIARDLTATEDDDSMMAVRERALAQLLRRRRFLEENESALIFRGNPYDQGAEADALIFSLSKTENDLFTLVKRGERGRE